MSESFRDAYLLESWGEGSGIGSTPENTAVYRQFIQSFLAEHGIRSVADLGCGDWQFSRLIDWSGIDYVGVDVVPEVIEANRELFGDRFLCMDFSREELPEAGLAIVKDVLQHWPNATIQTFMGRLRRYRFALIINCAYEDEQLNQDIGMGGFRPLDLRREPFCLDLEEVLRFRSEGVPAEGDNKQVLLMRNR